MHLSKFPDAAEEGRPHAPFSVEWAARGDSLTVAVALLVAAMMNSLNFPSRR